MKKSRFSEQKIVSILKQAEDGMSVQDLCREHGISNATFYNWRSKYGGMSVSMLKRMKELEVAIPEVSDTCSGFCRTPRSPLFRSS